MGLSLQSAESLSYMGLDGTVQPELTQRPNWEISCLSKPCSSSFSLLPRPCFFFFHREGNPDTYFFFFYALEIVMDPIPP